jgi:cation/acetate symporter
MMLRGYFRVVPSALLLLWSDLMFAAGALEGAAERQALNPIAIGMFLLFVALTLYVTWWASKATKTSSTFYNAGGQITGAQNGLAIAGDFMSAASFLGITGLMYVGGFDGLILSLGAFGAWPVFMFLFAKRVRNLGNFTFIDVISQRLDRDPIRLVTAFSTILIVIMYLIAQMVGAGTLIQLLFGLPYEWALLLVSVLVLAYVAFGGMLATTWVQIIKAALLLTGVTLIAGLLLADSGFSFSNLLGKAVVNHPKGEAILGAGAIFSDPVQILTIQVSMLFGTVGLPHILMRLFTVPDMRQAKLSSYYASLFIGYFYIALLVLGFGSIAYVAGSPEFFDGEGKLIGGSNMAAIHVASAMGGDLLTGFMSAVCFATILAVVAGLTLSGAAAISHDVYAEVLKKGKPDPKTELRLTRVSVFLIGLAAVSLGIIFQHENIAFIATIPMVVSASVTFPILFLSLFWSGFTTRGAMYGAGVGLVSSIVLIVLGPQVWVSVLGNGEPIFPYDYPALFTMPASVLVMVIVSLRDRSDRGAVDRENYARLLVRSEFGASETELAESGVAS